MNLLEKKLFRAQKAIKVLEEELESKSRLLYKEKKYSENIIQNLSDPLVITDAEGVVLNFNKSFLSLVADEDLTGRNIEDIVKNKKAFKNNAEISYTFRWEDEKRDVILTCREIKNQRNDTQYVFMFKDVTEFNKQLKSYANFAQLDPSPVFRVDIDGNVLNSNLVAIERFEIFDNFNWFDVSEVLDTEMAEKIIKHSRIYVEEIEHNDKFYYFQYRGIRSDNYINVYGFDVTEQKLNEQKIKELQDDLIDEAYSQGIAENSVHVLHNIGNVLTTMIGKGDQLKKELNKKATTTLFSKVLQKLNGMKFEDLNDKSFEALKSTLKTISEKMQSEGEKLIETNNFTLRESLRISEIISTQQKYANLKTRMNSLVRVESLIHDIVTMHKYRIDKRNIQLSLEVCPDTEVYVEKVGLSQTISNAIVNAIESIDEKAKSERLEDEWILEITTIKKGDNLSLAIADNGMGIKKDVLEKLFNYGFSTKERGSGFGLHNCANYMQSIGGNIEILSDGEFCGAQTVITLPIHEENEDKSNLVAV